MRLGPILGLCLCVLGLGSCDFQKYPDGPFVSVQPTKDRVIDTWRWKVVIEDGVVNTGAYRDSTITFQSDQVVQICAGGNCREGLWDLVRKRTQFQLVFGEQTILFDITMLTQSEIWLRNAQRSDSASLSIEWDLEVLE